MVVPVRGPLQLQQLVAVVVAAVLPRLLNYLHVVDPYLHHHLRLER